MMTFVRMITKKLRQVRVNDKIQRNHVIVERGLWLLYEAMVTSKSSSEESRIMKQLLIALLSMFVPCTLVSADDIFMNQFDFLDAAAPLLIEDFEMSPLSGDIDSGGLTAITFDFFTASSVPDAVKVFGADLPNGNQNTTPGGSRFLSFDTDTGGVSADATLTFDQPTAAMGFFLVDIEDGATVTIDGISYSVPSSASGGQAYFGLIADSPFTSALIDAGNDSHWSIDDVAVTAVPEPVSSLSFLLAANMLMLVRKR